MPPWKGVVKPTMRKSATEYVDAVRHIYHSAEAAGRELTPSERGDVEGLLECAESQRKVEGQLKSLGEIGAPLTGWLGSSPGYGGPGDRFVASAGYQRIK